MATTLLAHAARELPGEGPHGLAHLTKLGRRCREHVHVLEPAGRDQPGARDAVGLVAQPSPHLLREHATVLLEAASEVVPQRAQLGRIAVARSRARLDHRGDEQVREVEGTQDTVEEVPLAARRGVHPRVAVDSIDREQSEGVDVRVAQCPEQLGAEVRVGDANTRRRRAGDSRVANTTICGDRVTTTTEWEALVEQRREDREVLGPLDQRRLHRGAQTVAIEQIDVPHRRRRVEHLTERDVDAAVSQCGEQAKQHREDAIACGCHRLPSLTFISATLSSSACRIGPLSSSRLTRPAWVDTLIAAIARPDRSRNGAATDRTPSSSSWSTNAHPCERTWRINPRSRIGSVSVCSDRFSTGIATSRACSSSSGRSASSTRPIDVIAAGRREPSDSEIVMIRFVGTRATYTISSPSSTDADTDSCTRSDSASM